jgi:hypothetical protein
MYSNTLGGFLAISHACTNFFGPVIEARYSSTIFGVNRATVEAGTQELLC